MTFNEVLSQTIAMLYQHGGRVSYRALKRQFGLPAAAKPKPTVRAL